MKKYVLGLLLVLVPAPAFTQPATPTLKIVASIDQPVLLPKTLYPQALKVTVSGARAADAKKLRAAVLKGPVEIGEGALATIRTMPVPADTKTVLLPLRTSEAGRFAIQFVALDANDQPLKTADNKELPEATEVFIDAVSSGFANSFMSDRVSSDLFIGMTFANEYKPDDTSDGFSDAAPLARLSFDTMWHPWIVEGAGDPTTPGRGTRARRRHRPAAIIHTGLEMQFASFPFGESVAGNVRLDRDSAFTGSIYAMYQPSWLASYTATSQRTDRPIDAMQFGFFGRAGFTTRTKKKRNGDHDISRYSAGVKFTHHQTDAPTQIHERVNHPPMRFVEASLTRFEDWPSSDPVKPQTNEWRVLIDAGLRLPGVGSEMIPFYAGVHANVGGGPDDLRIFAGFLFQLDELVRLFQAAQPVR